MENSIGITCAIASSPKIKDNNIMQNTEGVHCSGTSTPLVAENTFNIPIVNTILGTILFLTIIEEYIKHLVVRFVDDKKIKDIDDAITLSIMVGLALSFTETIIYAIIAGDFGLMFYRAFLSLPVHLVASGIFGYYYGLAHFSKPLLEGFGKK